MKHGYRCCESKARKMCSVFLGCASTALAAPERSRVWSSVALRVSNFDPTILPLASRKTIDMPPCRVNIIRQRHLWCWYSGRPSYIDRIDLFSLVLSTVMIADLVVFPSKSASNSWFCSQQPLNPGAGECSVVISTSFFSKGDRVGALLVVD